MTGKSQGKTAYAIGAMLPLFAFASDDGKPFVFGSLGGRRVILTFIPASCTAFASAFALLLKQCDSTHCCFVGLCDSAKTHADIRDVSRRDDVQILQDPDAAIRRSLGIPAGKLLSVVLDRTLRTTHIVDADDPNIHALQLMDLIMRFPPPPAMGQAHSCAPVLMLDSVFDADLVARMIAAYDRSGGQLSGFMRTSADGKTVETLDPAHKVRRDMLITDEGLRQSCRTAIELSLVPAILRAFQFHVTRIERYLIGCYEPASNEVAAGHFNRHRDNTTKGTAHRRFAVSIGLNADDYDGGDIRFPEYDARLYRPSTGGAVVFSCSLLHEVLPVTRGRRLVFVPFLYDDAAEAIRQNNLQFLDSRKLG